MLDLGFDAYLTKPVKYSHLMETILTVLGLRHKPNLAMKTLVTQHVIEEADRRPFKILVVEDNVVNQKVAARMLERKGFRCDVAADGREAVVALSRISYDLVFMDCQMPVLDGFEATAEIRSREGESRHTPIVAMTANATKEDRERCLKVGMDDYLSKPVTASALDRILDKYITRETINTDTTPETGELGPMPLRHLQEMAAGDSDFERALIDEVLADCERCLQVLESALHANNIAVFKREARTIRSTSASIGTEGLLETASRLEEVGTLADPGPALELLASLKCQFEEVRNYFQDHVNSSK